MSIDKDQLVAEMRRQRNGNLPAMFEYLAKIDPDFLAGYNAATLRVFNYSEGAEDRALDARMKELIAVALLASVRGGTTKRHIAAAYRHGASKREVVEALEVAFQITGAPSMEFGIHCMMDLDAGGKEVDP